MAGSLSLLSALPRHNHRADHRKDYNIFKARVPGATGTVADRHATIRMEEGRQAHRRLYPSGIATIIISNGREPQLTLTQSMSAPKRNPWVPPTREELATELLLLRKHLPGVWGEDFKTEFSCFTCQVLKLLHAMLFLVLGHCLFHVLPAIFEQAVDEFGQVVGPGGYGLLRAETGMQHSLACTVWTLAIAQGLGCDPEGYGCAERDFSCCAFLDAPPDYSMILA